MRPRTRYNFAGAGILVLRLICARSFGYTLTRMDAMNSLGKTCNISFGQSAIIPVLKLQSVAHQPTTEDANRKELYLRR
jgi:hypothetical protein